MSKLGRILASFTSARLQRDVHDEVEFHIEMKTRELVAGGAPLAEARAQARRQFGNVAAIEEHTRDIDRVPLLDALGRDLRYSFRALRKSPTFTAVAVATIALGIAANLAVFGMVDALFFRPLPYPDSKNIVMLGTRTNHAPLDWASAADWFDWRAQSATLERLSAYSSQSVNLTGDREPERVIGGFVSADFLPLFGAAPLRGRIFQPGDDQPGAPPVVIASYHLWQTRYGGDADFLGRKLILNGQPFTVAGVLPQDFYFPWSKVDVWIPYLNYPNFRPNARADLNTGVFGHVRSGHSVEQARAEMTAIATRLAAQFPETNRGREAVLFNFHDFLVQDLRSPLLLLWSAVGLVFLIACANLANLALSRALSREQEMRVRLALGAGRWQLFSQAAVENLLLAVAGLAVALPLGAATLRSLERGMENVFPLGTVLDLDFRCLAYGAALALFAAALCAAFAAGQIWKRRASTAPDAVRGATERRGHGAARRVLVVAELALSIVLLSGAGLLLKSYARLSSVDPGFRGAHVLTAEYRVPRNKYPTPEQQWAMHWAVVQKLRQIPGVRSASAIFALPFSGNGGVSTIVLPDRPTPPRGSEPRAILNRIAPGALETLGVPIVRGRSIEERDDLKAARVAVISRSFAEQFWPGQDPIGRVVKVPDAQNTTYEVVGVVGDIRQWQLDEPARPQLYVSFAQAPHIFSTVMIETAGDPAGYATALRQAVWAVDKDQPVWKVRTLESLTDGFLKYRSLLPRVLAGFAAFALLLAAIGIYGVIAYSTARRTREFGLRLAIGAQPRDVSRLVLRDGLILTLAGSAIGAGAAIVLARVLQRQLRAQLFRVEATDPATLVVVVGVLAAVSLLACYIPARRALRLDPLTALRHE